MTEQQNQSAVVEETREAVDTTSQPENNVEKKNGGSKTSLALSAIAIAIALAAGIGLYGLTKTQATRQSEASAGLSSQIAALQKAQESQKSELEGRRLWRRSWKKFRRRLRLFPAATQKPGCSRRRISS